MANVIEFTEFATCVGTELHCWLCQKDASARALFCHHCGTIQPVREIDHFARLGLERRIDVDLERLERQYGALTRTLDPARFALRGVGERGHASKQLEALNTAYECLRDPLRRSRYWLVIHAKDCGEGCSANALVTELSAELASAAEPGQCDRVAHRAGIALEEGIMGVLQALRLQNWQKASTMLGELSGIETILATVRARRASLAPEGQECEDWARGQ